MTADVIPKNVKVSLRDVVLVLITVIPMAMALATSWFSQQGDIRALQMEIVHLKEYRSDERSETRRWRAHVDEMLRELLQRRADRSSPSDRTRGTYPGRQPL